MFAGMRNKKKPRDSPATAAVCCSKQDQPGKRKDAAPEPLSLPSPPKYYPGTQMPVDGWYHACRLCRCWTAFSATATTGEVVPLCRRCLPSATRKSVQAAPRVPTQQPMKQQLSHASSSTAVASTARGSNAAPAAASQHNTANSSNRTPQKSSHRARVSDAPAKGGHFGGHTYNSSSSQQQQHHHQQQHHQQQQQQLYKAQHHAQMQQQQQQQQRSLPKPAPGAARSTVVYKAGSRTFRSTGHEEFLATSQVTAAAAAATAAANVAAVSTPAAPAHQHRYARASSSSGGSSSSVNKHRGSSGGGGYASCYKHLGPTNVHEAAAAPADAYITCLGNGHTDVADNNATRTNSSSSGGQQGGSDMLGALTSLLSDLYRMGFSSSGGSASSRSSSSNGSGGQELASRSNSMSKKQAAVTAAAAAADSLRNLPI